jgi:hypothetical protein
MASTWRSWPALARNTKLALVILKDQTVGLQDLTDTDTQKLVTEGNLTGVVFEVFGGTHTAIALQHLKREFPDEDAFKLKRCRVFSHNMPAQTRLRMATMDNNQHQFADTYGSWFGSCVEMAIVS